MGFVDSWAAVASGGLSLSENHLYTVEAFRAYYDHLTPDGQIVILRWTVDIPRLVSNAVAMLGPEEAGQRVAVLLQKNDARPRGPAADDVHPEEAAVHRGREGHARLARDHAAGGRARPARRRAVRVPLLGKEDLRRSSSRRRRTRVDPVYDDRPFFFARQKPWGLPDNMRRAFLLLLTPVLALCALLLVFGKPRGERTRAVCRVDRLLRRPRHRLHRRGAGAPAAPHAAPRPPDLHAVDPAVHAPRRGRPRQRLRRPAPAVARVPRGGGRSPSSTRSRCRGVVPALLPLPLVARIALAVAARRSPRLPHGDAVPARARADRARGRSRRRRSTGGSTVSSPSSARSPRCSSP